MKSWLIENFNIKYPIIMAPMFLVSNNDMVRAASDAGIMGCIPALNWKDRDAFKGGLLELKKSCHGPFGVNLIVNRSNPLLDAQLSVLTEIPIDFVITSLGSPQKTIDLLRPKGTKIFCDVVNSEQAKKVESLGADAIIAVNSGAGGHAGNIPATVLLPMLKRACSLPIISAGGVNTGKALLSTLALGAEGVSIGSPFIGCNESRVNEDYKQAVIQYGAEDIVMTDKISGTPCTVIKTPYVKKIGTNQNLIERFLNNNKKLKKYAKMLTYHKGMKLLEKAAFSATYKSVWCAGPSIEFTKKSESVKETVERLINEYKAALEEFERRK